MNIPTLAEILAGLQHGVNPFLYGALLVNELRFPTVPRGTDAILITFSIFHALTAISCVVIICRLCFPSSSKLRAQNVWLFKNIYLEDDNGILVKSMPLYLPNSGLLMAGFQFLASMVAQIFIWFTFFSFRSYEIAAKIGLPIGLYVSWLFGFYAFWSMAWASTYTRLYTQKAYVDALKSAPFYMFTPRNLNAFFIFVPTIVTFAEALLIHWICAGLRVEHRQFADLQASMKVAAAGWDELNSITDATKALMIEMTQSASSHPTPTGLKEKVLVVMKAGADLLETDIKLIHTSRVVAFVWGTILVFTSLIYIMAMWSLIRLIKNGIPGESKPKIQVGVSRRFAQPVPRASSDQSGFYRDDSVAGLVDNEQEALSIKQGYRYLSCHSLVMVLAIVYSSVACFLLGVKAEEVLLTARWRRLGSWLSLLSGVFVGIGMSFQMWRTWVDLDIIIPVQDPNVVQPAPEPTWLGDSEPDKKSEAFFSP